MHITLRLCHACMYIHLLSNTTQLVQGADACSLCSWHYFDATVWFELVCAMDRDASWMDEIP